MRASSLILSSLCFIHDLRTGVLPPDDMRGIPLDMTQYTRLFGTARIPTNSGCRIETDPLSRHIVVMRRGQFFWFDVLDSKHRPLLTERALHINLEAIVAEADKTSLHNMAAGSIGVLSTENRKVWAKRREAMEEDQTNRAMLEIVDTALFVVCLDDTEPASPNELAESMLCGTYKIDRGVQVGTCCNRWYEKVRLFSVLSYITHL
jgi:carnitine O-acetyltransferase